MLSFLAEIEAPWLRLLAFVALMPLLWFALLFRVMADGALAPIALRRRRPR